MGHVMPNKSNTHDTTIHLHPPGQRPVVENLPTKPHKGGFDSQALADKGGKHGWQSKAGNRKPVMTGKSRGR